MLQVGEAEEFTTKVEAVLRDRGGPPLVLYLKFLLCLVECPRIVSDSTDPRPFPWNVCYQSEGKSAPMTHCQWIENKR